jgi:FKBP-type peptidyl-prolyl cis-trans isomerase FkpA/FKBP-type peptidyl-prolyl cis-trans isomerase FklB
MPDVRRSLAALLVLTALACSPPGAQNAPEVKLDTDDAKVIYGLGLLLAQRIESFGLTEAELVIFEDGLRDGVLGREQKVDPATLDAQLQAFANRRRVAAAEGEKKAGAAYLEQMAAEPGATKAESGYVLRTLTEGTGASPGATDTVTVHYHGTLRDGKVFDSSVERGTPASFPLDRVIPCWTQSLQQMKIGGKYKLTCPSDIAYGDRGSMPNIKPGATLTFEVELLDAKPTAAAAPHGMPAPEPAPEPKK